MITVTWVLVTGLFTRCVRVDGDHAIPSSKHIQNGHRFRLNHGQLGTLGTGT